MTPEEELRKATVAFLRTPHPRDDDEDLHPARLDATERELERALHAHGDKKKSEKEEARDAARERAFSGP